METLKMEEIKALQEPYMHVFKIACLFCAKQDLEAASQNI